MFRLSFEQVVVRNVKMYVRRHKTDVTTSHVVSTLKEAFDDLTVENWAKFCDGVRKYHGTMEDRLEEDIALLREQGIPVPDLGVNAVPDNDYDYTNDDEQEAEVDFVDFSEMEMDIGDIGAFEDIHL